MAEQLSKSIQNIMNTDPSNIDRESDEFKEFLQDGSLDDLTQLAHNAKFDGEDDLLGSVYGEITDRLDQAVRDNFITKEELDDRLNKIDSIIESDPANNNQPAVQKLAATAVTVANKTNNLNTNSANSGKAANTLPNSTKSKSQAPMSSRDLLIKKEMEDELEEAKNEYAMLTAKDRKSYIRSGRVARFLAKIPGLRRFTENRNQSIETEEAKERYDAASKALIEWELKSLENAGYDEDAKRQEIINVLVDRDLEFENEVVEQRMQQSKKTNKFVNFWERSRGITKIISAGGAGFITGAVFKTAQSIPHVGGYFPGLVVKGAGAAAGAWMAGHVRKRRANAEIKDANGNLVTLAEAQSNEDFNNKKTIIENIVNSADISKGSDSIDVGRISHATEQRTKSEVRGNKLRLATTAIKGFAGASVGEYIVGHAQSMMAGADTNAHHIVGNTNDAAMNNSHSTAPSAESAPTTSGAEPTDTLSAAEPMHSPDTTGMVEGHNFYVQDGSGYSQELIDFANANGQTLTPDQSMELHQHLVDKFGPDYINIDGVTTDTYLDGNDIRLSAPGNASWENGVPDAVREWMINNGLWNR